MARGVAASSSREDNQDASQAQGDPKVSKRRCIQSACVPCRRRKSKCDGGAPVCATCTAVYKTECYYDTDSEGRRSKTGSSAASSAFGTKRDASLVKPVGSESSCSAEFMIKSLQQLPDDQVYELFQLIRSNPKLDIGTLAEVWSKAVTIPFNPSLKYRNLQEEFNSLLSEAKVIGTKEHELFSHSLRSSLFPSENDLTGSRTRKHSAVRERQVTTWTSVTDDLGLVEHLLSLYFKWSHSFHVLFSWEHFYEDFRTGRAKHCSSLLVNAICAYASHFTVDPALRTDPSNTRTAGDRFFAEAERLLFDDEAASLTTIQALAVMSMRESSAGRESSGFSYIGRSIRMCVSSGLHLKQTLDSMSNLERSEIEILKTTFWGCFMIETLSSISTGHISQLHRAAITLDKPVSKESASSGAPRSPPEIWTADSFLREFASFSELMNDSNYMLLTSKQSLTGSKILNLYVQYQKWYEALPSPLVAEDKSGSAPHVLVFHMLYYSMIIYLFRPMLAPQPMDSNIYARDICIKAATNASQLFRIYRSLGNLPSAHLAVPQILLSICVVHLLFSKNNGTSHRDLIEGLKALNDLHQCHYLGAKNFQIIYTLAKTWGLLWPEELGDSDLISKEFSDRVLQAAANHQTDPQLEHSDRDTIGSGDMESHAPYLPIDHIHTKQVLPIFGQGLRSGLQHLSSQSSHAIPIQQYDPNLVGHTPTQPTFNTIVPSSPYHYHQTNPSGPPNPPDTAATSPARSTMGPVYWNTFPGMPELAQAHGTYPHTDPIAAESAIQSIDTSPQPGQGGFKNEGEWQSENISNFSPVGAENIYAAPTSQVDVGFVRSGSGYDSSSGTPYQQPTREDHHERGQGPYDPSWWPNTSNNPN